MKKYFYIFRHGETDLNKKGVCQGHLGIPVKFPGSDGILSYINKSIKDELTREKKWSSKGDSLAIDFKEIFFSTIQKYNWRFKGTLKYQNKAKKDFKFTYEIPAVMWSKYNCKHAISDYKKAQRELFRTFYNMILKGQ